MMDDKTGDMKYLPMLDMTNILEIQIFNKMNEFMQTGSLTYVDDRQIVDKMVGSTLAYLEVQIQKNSFVGANKPLLNEPDPSMFLSDRFLVDTIDLLDRSSDRLTYRISFVDKNFLSLTRNLSYSCFDGDQKTNIGDILKKLFKKAELKINEETLKNIGTSLKYITKDNDNLMTSFRFLMRRDFYMQEGRSESLNVILQNTNKGEYGIYNMMDPDVGWINDPRFKVSNMVDLSLFTQEQLEAMTSKTENGLETLNLKGRTQVIDSFHNVVMSTYDQESNAFGEYRIETKDIVNLYGKTKGTGYDPRYANLKDVLENHHRAGAQWDNDFNVYEDQIDNLINFDSLVVEVDGSTNRIPGMEFFIMIRTPNVGVGQMGTPGGSQNQKTNDDKYSRFVGLWTISSVRHVFRPAEGFFKDSICLFRNKN